MKCLYHANCNDGMAAALAVWLAHPEASPERDFIPVQYGYEPPWEVIKGEEVVIVDFCYKRNVLEQMARTAKSIVILDHHRSAERELVAINNVLPNVFAQFDMEHSGAVMAWHYFHPGKALPWLFAYVQDRDLWLKQLPGTDDVTMYLRSYPMDLRAWKRFISLPVEEMRDQGMAINRWLQLQCRQMVDTWVSAPVYSIIGGLKVPVTNAPGFFSSEVAGLLSKGHAFAAVFFHVRDGVVYSLRRHEGEIDVSVVAQSYGGGGHAAAAGFRVESVLPMIS